MENTLSWNDDDALKALMDLATRLRDLFGSNSLKEGELALRMVAESMKLEKELSGKDRDIDEFILELRDAPKWCALPRDQKRYEDSVKESYEALTCVAWPALSEE